MKPASEIQKSIIKTDLDNKPWEEILPLCQQLADLYLAEVRTYLTNDLSVSPYEIFVYVHSLYTITKKHETSAAYSLYASFSRTLSIYTSRIDLFPARLYPTKISLTSKQEKLFDNRIIYIFDNDAWLGHIQIFSSFAQNTNPNNILVVFRNKVDDTNKFIKTLTSLSIPFVFISSTSSSPDSIITLLRLLASLDAKRACKAYVWVGFPPLQTIGGLQHYETNNFVWQFKYYFPLSINHDVTLFGYALKKQIGVKQILE